MIFRSAHLVNFKGYEEVRADFHPVLTCIVGDNGAGKTNLMDALYYCCFTKSHFNHGDQFVFRRGTDYFRIDAVAEKEGRHHRIVIRSRSGERRTISLDDREVERITDYIGIFPAVMIAPDDNALILEGSRPRRRFADACIGQYDGRYLTDLLQYQKLLQRRNSLLKQYRLTRRIDETLLEAIDDQMSGTADYLFRARKDFLEDFRKVFTEKYRVVSGKAEDPGLAYASELEDRCMRDLLRQNREADRAASRTTGGPHRDDLLFTLGGQPLKNVGSQGQQKSYLVALKLAQYELLKTKTGVLPFLFMDDLFDKFDDRRVAHVLDMVGKGEFGQVFVTHTHAGRVEDILKMHNLQYSMIHIENGSILHGKG